MKKGLYNAILCGYKKKAFSDEDYIAELEIDSLRTMLIVEYDGKVATEIITGKQFPLANMAYYELYSYLRTLNPKHVMIKRKVKDNAFIVAHNPLDISEQTYERINRYVKGMPNRDKMIKQFNDFQDSIKNNPKEVQEIRNNKRLEDEKTMEKISGLIDGLKKEYQYTSK